MNREEMKLAAIGFLPGLIMGAALVWSVQTIYSSSKTVANSADRGTDRKQGQGLVTSPGSATSDTVEIRDQPAGRAVLVESARLRKPTWLAVREVTSVGTVGNILGAVLRDLGGHTAILIDLLRATEPNRAYTIVLYEDTGDNAFDPKKDVLLKAPGGALFEKRFKALTPLSPTGK